MKQDPIKVEIVAPVHNRREITLQCLRSLARIDTTGLDVHIVIVDDGSTDGTGNTIRSEFPDVEVVEGSGDLWFTEGTNVGVRAAMKRDPQYVLTINDDAVFDENFLRHMVQTAETDTRSVVGSLLLLWDMPHRLFQVSPVWDTWSGGWRHWQHQTVWTIPEKPWEVELIVGNCVLVPARAIREHGLMDSARYPNFGDAEYTPRLRKKGYKLLIDPRARVFCQPNNVPKRVGRMSLKEMTRALIFDLGNIHNLRRRYYSLRDAAPTRLKGLAAFAMFFTRAIFRISPESSWSEKQKEKPLAEIFAQKVVETR